MVLVNALQTELLESLGRFQYLSVLQCQRITQKSLGYLRTQLGILVERKLISSYRVVVTARVRAENIYYLTLKGRALLLENAVHLADDVKLPLGHDIHIVRDYFHRYHFLDVQIALRLYFQNRGIQLVQFLTYFDKAGNARSSTLRAQTTLPLAGQKVFIPDGIFITADGEKRTLYLLEHYEDKHSTRALKSLGQIAHAIALGTPGRKFDIAANPIVLAVFAHPTIKDKVIQKLRETEAFKSFRHLYFFASLDAVQRDMQSAFVSITGERLDLT